MPNDRHWVRTGTHADAMGWTWHRDRRMLRLGEGVALDRLGSGATAWGAAQRLVPLRSVTDRRVGAAAGFAMS